MSTSLVELNATAVAVAVNDDFLHVVLVSGRELSAPVACFRDCEMPASNSEKNGV